MKPAAVTASMDDNMAPIGLLIKQWAKRVSSRCKYLPQATVKNYEGFLNTRQSSTQVSTKLGTYRASTVAKRTTATLSFGDKSKKKFMPVHWDWDWDLTHDHSWHWTRLWPWDTMFDYYHYKCPLRRRYWGLCSSPSLELDVCAGDWHFHHNITTPWCHRSCLSSKAFIETGDEIDTNGKGTFKVVIDVHHFRCDELVVKVKNNDTVVVEGKQKDDRAKKNEVLCMTKEFTRKFKLPRNYDATQAKSTLSADGILTVIVPVPPPLDDVERLVEIVKTGVYYGSSADNTDAKAIEGMESDEKKVKMDDN